MPELYLGRWVWDTSEASPYWRSPRPDLLAGSLDLRSLPQCGSPGPTPQGFGLFALSARDDTVGYYLGDGLDATVKAPLKRALKTALGLGEDIVTSTPLGIVLELFNRYADPTGQVRWKPLRVSRRAGLRLHIAGQLYQEAFAETHPAFANTIAVFQADYRRNRAEDVPLTALRKWTGMTMLKLWGRMGDDLAPVLLPSEYVSDGWETPATVITESFNKADNGLGPDLTWTVISGTWGVLTNEGYGQGSVYGIESAHAGSTSSDDMYGQVILRNAPTTSNAVPGVSARNASGSTRTWYSLYSYPRFSSRYMRKMVTGSETALQDSSGTWSTGDEFEIRADGSTISVWVNNSQIMTNQTDTAITNNLRAGLLYGQDNAAGGSKRLFGLFEAGDLAAGAARRIFVVS